MHPAVRRLVLVGGFSSVVVVAGSCGRTPEPPAGQAGVAGFPDAGSGSPPAATPASSRSEKDRARAEPYANDLGPATLPAALVASYPPAMREAYELTIVRCAQCHDAARPLNSDFVDADTWRRYVKRMMAKPGCAITGAEGKRIWEFLVYDSKIRKTGANTAAWAAHWKELLRRFKAERPERYRLLYGDRPAG